MSFQQAAVDRFHELVPRIDLAPGIDGAAACVDGTMTSHPRAYERVLTKHKRPASCG